MSKIELVQDYQEGTRTNIQHLLRLLKIKHFSEWEILETLQKNDVKSYIPYMLIRNLAIPLIIYDAMREDLGIKIRLTSTYRDVKHNREVDGRPKSLHLRANAVDAQPYTLSEKNVWKMHRWIKNANIMIRVFENQSFLRDSLITKKYLGIGYYDDFLHIDARGIFNDRYSPVTWGKAK